MKVYRLIFEWSYNNVQKIDIDGEDMIDAIQRAVKTFKQQGSAFEESHCIKAKMLTHLPDYKSQKESTK